MKDGDTQKAPQEETGIPSMLISSIGIIILLGVVMMFPSIKKVIYGAAELPSPTTHTIEKSWTPSQASK